jgi:type II restriction/modification system DNA methylase subunit YeeA
MPILLMLFIRLWGLISNKKMNHSWDFQSLPIMTASSDTSPTLEFSYTTWTYKNHNTIAEMKRLEEENNRLFIDAYGLQDELTFDVPLEQITLTVNPKYRYGGNLSDQELENRFQSDSLAELISYAIGCMLGRYSVDREGLVYAHAGNEGFNDLVKEGAYNTFPADDDGIIPLTDEEWFEDDLTLRFREFVQTVWDKENLQANLDFVAESLRLHAVNAKSGETSLDTIRRYLSTQFYKDHLKTYKKRPIYWLFSSGKQKAFECLVYLHRYNESTLARMRTEYVSPLLGKYDAYADTLSQQIEQAPSTAEANRLSKSLIALEKKQTELREFDDKLKHHADMQIKLDLDDGVKVNYGKFGDLLVDVKGVTGKK